MAFVLSIFLTQPSRNTTQKSLPKWFQDAHIENVTCIIDCLEIFIDRPFNLDARAQTYSNYKHHTTIKFLIACTPSREISFISKTYDGHLTDEDITKQNSLDTIKENDLILAYQDFRIGSTKKCQCHPSIFHKRKEAITSNRYNEIKKDIRCTYTDWMMHRANKVLWHHAAPMACNIS